jgi:hypothetical protein
MNLEGFSSWSGVLAYARTGGPLYYQAPMDHRPTRLSPCHPGYDTHGRYHDAGRGCGPYQYFVRARTIRIWPPGSVGRGRGRTADPFSADAGHLGRFSKPVNGSEENPMRRFHKKNPMTSTEDLLLAGAGVAVLALVGYAMYSKSQAAQTQVTPANQNVTQWNQTSQEAYDAWYAQYVQQQQAAQAAQGMATS